MTPFAPIALAHMNAHIERRVYRCVVLPGLIKATRTWRNDRRKEWRAK